MNIEIDDENINVKEIMRQIKESTSKIKLKDDLSSSLTSNHSNEGFTNLEKHQYILNRIWSYSSYNPITSNRKVLGNFIIFVKKVIRKLLYWYINPIVEKQNDFNAEVTRTLNSFIDQMKYMDKNESSDLVPHLSKINEEIFNLRTEIMELQSRSDEYVLQINTLKQENIHLRRQQEKNEAMNRSIRIATERLKRIERTLKHGKPDLDTISETTAKLSEEADFESVKEFDYYLFEEYFRGSREDIKNRQTQYLDYFKKGQHVADLGCGRGEFSELLLENGIKVTSVDINDEMVSYCKGRGFPVVKMDILSYLRTLESNTLDGIFLGQVIEHLNFNDFIELVNLSHEKLKPTGVLIAETPNPQCLSIFTQSFYMDPSHVKPIHPYTAKFVLESAGFHEIYVNYISPNDEDLRLPQLKVADLQSDSINQFNQTISKWNDVIFGYQDYYILGRK